MGSQAYYEAAGRVASAAEEPSLLRAALHALLDRAYQEKRWREERRLREEAEQERRRQEQILSERRRAQSKLIDELERQAGAWFRAKFLRRYVLAARRSLAGERIEVKLQNHSVDFLDWATAYVNQLNPLSPTPTNPDQQRERSPYWKAEEESLKNLLFRLFGCDGRLPWKLTAENSAGNDDYADRI